MRDIAAVIATRNREAMLSERALPSVVGQTHPPDYLVVIDDSCPEARARNSSILASIDLPGSTLKYLENARTQGASGSWNTALDYLFRAVEKPEQLFVAILDDDDAWAPTYLERCAELASAQDLDMVAADLHRIEAAGTVATVCQAPTSLRAADFLTGNPGIQGSNLFVRLSVLLSAGGFDEHLTSTTDRDLCIRICDLGTVRYRRLTVTLVDHFADAGRARLSTRGSKAKLDGLTAFWQKYAGRMTNAQRSAFCERALALFDWQPLPIPRRRGTSPVHAAPKTALVLGVVADNERPGDLLDIVSDLAECRDAGLIGLDVVLLEDGVSRGRRPLLDTAAKFLRDAGAGCFRFLIGRQVHDAHAGLFGARFDRPPEKIVSRERRRAMLATYSARIAQSRLGTVIWLLDDADRSGGDRSHRGGQVRDVLRRMGAVRVEQQAHSAFDSPPGTPVVAALDYWIERERVATAEHRIKRSFSLDALRLLGCGSEAVVFTDERTVYKCIDYWKTRMPWSQLDFLRGQVGRWAGVPGLYSLHKIVADGPWVVLTYDYEPSVPYRGGREEDLIRLLLGCEAVGVVCNNIHPKNLIVTEDEVKLIDYGSDIRPWSSLGFEHMARRAFLACRHAGHDQLRSLMRRALTEPDLPELSGYEHFRAKLDRRVDPGPIHRLSPFETGGDVPQHEPFSLYVGVISSAPAMLGPLLASLASLRSLPSIQNLAVVVLDNGSPTHALQQVARDVRRDGLPVALVSLEQQRRDATAGAFGARFRVRPNGQVGIAQARTMLQRYLGSLLQMDPDAFGWLLDDDMRVDDRARVYLPWLPAFRARGVDVLIGQYERSSPNPPINGVRVHLVDLLHNLAWLRALEPTAPLPDRSAENRALRARYPDYYYDLSRKHTAHLEMPHWLEPAYERETVAEAHARLLSGALGVLSGEPLTRPIVARMPPDLMASARDSVNRGGCTFALNHRPLTTTPNTIVRIRDREARRSDMVWAIVNRYYRDMTIKAVGFPIVHVGRVTPTPSLRIEKVQGELVGSALYAGLTGFLIDKPDHRLDFSRDELKKIGDMVEEQLSRRLRALEMSFYRIRGLGGAILRISQADELRALVSHLDRWFTSERFADICSGVRINTRASLHHFLSSLRSTADDFATATVGVEFVKDQLR